MIHFLTGILLGALLTMLMYLRYSKRLARWIRNPISRLGPIPPGFKEIKDIGFQLQDKLFDSEERYRILSENVAAAVIVHDSNGLITWCSPFTEVLTGYARSQIYAKKDTFLMSITQETDKPILTRALKILEALEPFQYRIRVKHSTGIIVWCEARTVPIIEDHDGPTMALTILLDATATALYQQQIEERNRELHDFTYMVSHDLKSPIFTIKGMINLMKQDSDKELSSDLKEALDHIERANHRLEHLVSGILELAKVSATHFDRVPVSCAKVLELVRDDYESQVKAAGGTIEFPAEEQKVEADETMLYQIISNLVGNAIKYRSSERALEIKIRYEKADQENRIILAVADNGRGIPKENHEHVFRPFTRFGKNDVEGTGVGLASVKRLVDKLGMEIGFESDGGAGAVFRLGMKKAG